MILFYLIFIYLFIFGENLAKHAVAKQYLDFVWHKLCYLSAMYAFSNQLLLTPPNLLFAQKFHNGSCTAVSSVV